VIDFGDAVMLEMSGNGDDPLELSVVRRDSLSPIAKHR
jgi:hypothetical protein